MFQLILCTCAVFVRNWRICRITSPLYLSINPSVACHPFISLLDWYAIIFRANIICIFSGTTIGSSSISDFSILRLVIGCLPWVIIFWYWWVWVTLKRVVWYFEEGCVVLYGGWCGTWRAWCGTLKKVVWYFEEGDVVLKIAFLIFHYYVWLLAVYVGLSYSGIVSLNFVCTFTCIVFM